MPRTLSALSQARAVSARLLLLLHASLLAVACGPDDSNGSVRLDTTPRDGGHVDAGASDASTVDAAPGLPSSDAGTDAASVCGEACEASWECGTARDECGQEAKCGSCAPDKLCQNHLCVDKCTGCAIDGECVEQGALMPGNACLMCNVAASTQAWSPRADGTSCEDGSPCTLEDSCHGGSCQGVAKSCDDGVVCNGQETCAEGSGECAPGVSTCTGDDVCVVATGTCESSCTGCLIDGLCHAPLALNQKDNNECQQCQPDVSKTAWQARVGDSCGRESECLPAGQCTAEATCHRVPTPKETLCGVNGNVCMVQHCDGTLGECIADSVKDGTPCGNAPAGVCDLQDACVAGVCTDPGLKGNGQQCGGNGTCNGSGADGCVCPQGYRLQHDQCVDIDECAEHLDGCDAAPDACHNVPGGFVCECPAEFEGNGLGSRGCTCDHEAYSPTCKPWSSMSASQNGHACGISDGALFCWGNNDYGQLGVGDKLSRRGPARVGLQNDWERVSAGYDFSCGIRAGALYCWGNQEWLKLANGLTPQRMGGDVSDWTEVITGLTSVCGLRNGGQIFCQGAGEVAGNHSELAALTEDTGYEHLAGAFTNACALRAGSLYCWGSNNLGQVGDGSTTARSEPTRIGSFKDWVAVDAGSSSCAVRANGAVYCWGSINDGKAPTLVHNVNSAASVATLTHAACALLTDDSVVCWGGNLDGDIGSSDLAISAPPTALPFGKTWEAVEASANTGCGIVAGGLYCWSENRFGERGTFVDVGRVGSEQDWVQVSVGASSACGLREGGGLWCWGSAVTTNFSQGPAWQPEAIEPATTWLDVSSGGVTCAIQDPGELYCWGRGFWGELGSGVEQATLATPTQVGQAADWQHVSVGWNHACGIRGAAGELYCWGYNGYGQLGDGSTSNRVSPTKLSGQGWTAVSAGYQHTCGTRGTELLCWGAQWQGAVSGVSDANPQLTPLKIANGNWQHPSAGYGHSCATLAGELWCWGANSSGQVGLGTTSYTASPMTHVGTSNQWTSLDALGNFTCGVQNGMPLCWGRNEFGQVSGRDFVDHNSPIEVWSGAWDSVDTGLNSACGIRYGELYCWGDSRAGALGNPKGLTPTAMFDFNDYVGQ
ncbi:MAG: hypothetical protein QM778_23745 [Myxococcales bacterium]